METTIMRKAEHFQISAQSEKQEKTTNIVRVANSLAALYRTRRGSLDAFCRIYKKRALQLTGPERRELHRNFQRWTR